MARQLITISFAIADYFYYPNGIYGRLVLFLSLRSTTAAFTVTKMYKKNVLKNVIVLQIDRNIWPILEYTGLCL